MVAFTPHQSRTLAHVFNNTQIFNDLFWHHPEIANRIRDNILDIELKGSPYSSLTSETVDTLDKALTEIGENRKELFPEIA